MGLVAFIFSSFFFATILSGPYLWNRYSQRLQIECAAWSCGLVLHWCLPSNSLRYFFFFFRHDFVRAISLEPLLAETPNWVCCLVLRSNFALLLTIQFTSLGFFFFLLLFFRQDFVRAISLEPLLAETPNWVCCLVLRSNFALLLTIQFASLISSLINIISLDVTSFNSAVTLKLKCSKVVCVEFFIFVGSLLGRTQGDREPVSLLTFSSLARQFSVLVSPLESFLCSITLQPNDRLSLIVSFFSHKYNKLWEKTLKSRMNEVLNSELIIFFFFFSLWENRHGNSGIYSYPKSYL